MIVNTLLSFVLLPLAALAAPTSTTRAPIKRSISLGARAVAPSAYIVAIKANTVDPANRGAWLSKIMSQAGVSMSDDETSSLRLGWNETVMNGIAGTFSDSTLDVIRVQSEVAYVEPGMCCLTILEGLLMRIRL